MSLTPTSITMLLDMVENRLSDMVVTDREDAKEQLMLKRALQELATLSLAQEKSAKRKAALRRPLAERPMLRASSQIMADFSA
jgi:hypothetical protein